MKKTSLFLLMIILLVSSTAFASPAPDWTADSICTRVASMAYYTQSVTVDAATGKVVESPMVKTHVFGYEANGYRTQYITYSPDGRQSQIYVYNYVDVGPDLLELTGTIEYDGPSKKVTSREQMSYDKVANTVTSIKTDVGGNLLSTTIYYANANNLDYLVEVYDATGKLINKTETEYNANKQMVSQVYTDFLTGKTTTTTREYAANSIRIAKEIVKSGNEVVVSTYEYDDFDDNWIVKNSSKSKNGTIESASLVLFEKVYRLITPFG